MLYNNLFSRLKLVGVVLDFEKSLFAEIMNSRCTDEKNTETSRFQLLSAILEDVYGVTSESITVAGSQR
jgi:hypothetical protein